MNIDTTRQGSAPASATAAGTTGIRAAGAALAVGPAVWAAGQIVVGDDIRDGVHRIDSITGVCYMLGLFALAVTLLRTGGTGDRKGRAIPVVLMVLLTCGIAFNIGSLGQHATKYEDLPPALMALDAGWPLSQLTMIVVGAAVAVVGRYRGFLRWQVLVCAGWFPVVMVAEAVLGPANSVYVSAAWLIGTYSVLGLRMLVRPGDLLER